MNDSISPLQQKVDKALNYVNTSATYLSAINDKYNQVYSAFQQAVNSLSFDKVNAKAAQDAYDLSFTNLISQQSILQSAKSFITSSSQSIANANNTLGVITQANTYATSALMKASTSIDKAVLALSKANFNVAVVRNQTNQAALDLGASKFNLQQAMNNLYVAQAVKQQADKASTLIQTQSSRIALASINSTNVTFTFGGCAARAYPSMSGVNQIIQSFPSSQGQLSWTLANNQTLLAGYCTLQSGSLIVGSYISYEGYLKDGCINALSIS